MNKKLILLLMVLLLITSAAIVQAQVLPIFADDDAPAAPAKESKMRGVFKPLTDAVGGLVGTITGEDASIWLRLVIGILVFSVIFAASSLIPQLNDNVQMRAVMAVALALGAMIIFKPAFLATVLGAYFMYGLALLIGFTLLGTVYLCYTVWSSTTLSGATENRIFQSLRYIMPALILLMFLGLMTQLGNAMANQDLVFKLSMGGEKLGESPAWLTDLMEYMVSIVELAIMVLVIAGIYVLIRVTPAAARRVYNWAGGESRLERVLHGLEGLFDYARAVRNDLTNAGHRHNLQVWTRRWLTQRFEPFLREARSHGAPLPAADEALGRNIALHVHNLPAVPVPQADIDQVITEIQGLVGALGAIRFTP